MKTWWIKTGCFLTGYNYTILSSCSEMSYRAVKRYTSAILIICILWAFIGFQFASQYLRTSSILNAIGASLIFCLIVIQIERQIIMSEKSGNGKYLIRIFIGLTVAILGSLIIDQLILKGDIEQINVVQQAAQVDTLFNKGKVEINNQIEDIGKNIINTSTKRDSLFQELAKHPVIKYELSQSTPMPITTTTVDSLKGTISSTKIIQTKSSTTNTVQNPKTVLISQYNQELEGFRSQLVEKNKKLLSLRDTITQQVKRSAGFLNDTKIMFSIITGSIPAAIVWTLWICLLLGLESLTLVIKAISGETDYDKTIEHHMLLQKKRLDLLAQTYHQ